MAISSTPSIRRDSHGVGVDLLVDLLKVAVVGFLVIVDDRECLVWKRFEGVDGAHVCLGMVLLTVVTKGGWVWLTIEPVSRGGGSMKRIV